MIEKRAVTLLSGGLDSATTLAIALSQGYEVYALSFDYGQRHSIELERADRLAKSMGAKERSTIKVDLRAIGGSALTSDIEPPKESDLSAPMKPGIPVTYVPARNTVFLSLALAYAETLDAFDIFIGVNALDYSGYPDCRQEYISAFETMANLATKQAVEGKQRTVIHTPLISMSKSEIIKTGRSLNVDYSLTWSCYDPLPDEKPCLRCDSCRIRLNGFATAGLTDPLLG